MSCFRVDFKLFIVRKIEFLLIFIDLISLCNKYFKKCCFVLYFVFVLYMYENKDPLGTTNMLHTSSVQRRYGMSEKLFLYNIIKYTKATVVPTESDSDVICCLQFLNKKLTCTLHLS